MSATTEPADHADLIAELLESADQSDRTSAGLGCVLRRAAGELIRGGIESPSWSG